MEDLNRNFNLISLYLNDIQKYELLTKEEEYELLRKIREDKDEDARHLLILSNLRLVISVAKKSMGNGLLLIDLISEGNIGLIKAINKFDYEKGHRFSTYAVWWIKQSIKKAVINNVRNDIYKKYDEKCIVCGKNEELRVALLSNEELLDRNESSSYFLFCKEHLDSYKKGEFIINGDGFIKDLAQNKKNSKFCTVNNVLFNSVALRKKEI